MSPAKVRAAIVLHKSALVTDLVRGLDGLPLQSLDAFQADPRDVDEVTTAELYDICAHRTADILRVRDAVLDWLSRHPELVDGEL